MFQYDYLLENGMRPPLKLDMLMYGKKKRSRIKIYPDGSRKQTGVDKKGKPVWEKENYYETVHKGEGGGLFPSVNHIYRRGRNGRPEYTAMAVSKFEEWQVDTQLWMDQFGWTTKDEKVYMDFYFYMPNDNRERDTHNAFKICCDALNKLIYEDDHTCLTRVMDFCKVEEGVEPYIEIFVHTQDELQMIHEKTIK